MAIEFARVRYLSRSSDGSATRQAAYIAREKIHDERTGQTYSFAHREAPTHCEVLLPGGAPRGFATVASLANAMELSENRKNSQTAREFVLALPADREVSHGDRVEMLRGFVQVNFADKGLGAIVSIHKPHPKQKGKATDPDSATANWHAHVLVTTRYITGAGMGAKARDLQPEVRRGAQGRSFVTEADRWGAIWRGHQNAYFREHGITTRVDPVAVHSGPNVGPVRFRGPGGMETEADAAKLAARNAEAVRDPAKVIEAVTKRNATFTAWEVERLLKNAGIEGRELRDLKGKTLALPGVVKLYDHEGQAIGRFTTEAVRRHERGIMADAAEVAQSRHRDLNVEPGRDLYEDQRRAFDYAIAAGGLKVIEGRAGTGKSFTLAAIKEAHEAAGYDVRALAPTREVVRALRKDGFAADTLHRELLHSLKRGQAKWDHRTVIIVDEAAMVDAKLAGELMAAARKAGAKVILAGDDRQLANPERGGLFRPIADQHGSVEITDVRRQSGWQKQASEDMAAGAWGRAVQAFDAHGAIRWTESDATARAALVAAWAADTKAHPGTDRFVFAYTNRDVDELNRELREVRIDRGELGEGREFLTKHGRAEFAVGDRVQFTGNSKANSINNGTVGTITDIGKGRLAAQLDDGQVVQWKPSDFHAFRHGYAGTVYKGQGRTITQTYLLHTRHWHSTSSYVALTRQTESAQVFVSRQSAVDVATLAQQMGRTEERGASIRWHTIEDVPRLQAAVAANDQDVVRAQGTASRLIRSAYRDTAAAAERLSSLVERDGWQEAVAQVSADPTILGQLAGRDGFLAGARSRGDRLAALQSIDRAITWIDRLPALTDQAIERRQQDKAYSERAEEAYAERDAVQEAVVERKYQRAAAAREASRGRDGPDIGM